MYETVIASILLFAGSVFLHSAGFLQAKFPFWVWMWFSFFGALLIGLFGLIVVG